MKLILSILLILFQLQQSAVVCTELCLAGVEPLISGQRYRVQDQFFSSDLAESASASDSRLDGNVLCSPVLTQQPWLQVEFGSNVVIRTLQTAGDNGTSFDSYITSFQIWIGNSTGELETVMRPNSSVPMVFTRLETYATEDTDLPSPITTRVLRIVVLTWTPNEELCIDMEALGCLAEPLCDGDSPLTEDRDLLSLSSITASSEALGNPAEDIVTWTFLNRTWCSTQPFSEDPYVQLNFSSEVTLTHMFARGDALGLSFVTEFHLEILEGESGNFAQYGVTDEPTVFTTDFASDVLYTFWRPAQGTVFKFVITDGVVNPLLGVFCWNINIHGCLFNESAPPFNPPMETTIPMETAEITIPMEAAANLHMATTIDAMDDPMENTTDAMETTTDPMETTTDPMENTTDAMKTTTDPMENTTDAMENTTDPMENTNLISTDVPEATTGSPPTVRTRSPATKKENDGLLTGVVAGVILLVVILCVVGTLIFMVILLVWYFAEDEVESESSAGVPTLSSSVYEFNNAIYEESQVSSPPERSKVTTGFKVQAGGGDKKRIVKKVASKLADDSGKEAVPSVPKESKTITD